MTGTTASSGDVPTSDRLETVLVQQLGGAVEDEGRRVLVDGTLVVGRDSPLFADRYPKISRRHAEVSLERDRLRVVDLGSRHGTFIQGKRVERGAGVLGDLIEIGGIGFLVTQGPRDFVPAKHPRIAHASHRIATVLKTITNAARSRQPITITGESGVGKSALAEELLFASPEGAAVVVDRLDETDRPAQNELLAALRRAEAEPTAPRVVVISCVRPAELVRRGELLPRVGAYLDGWVIEVPPLRDRLEDVLPIVRARLASLAEDDDGNGVRWEIQPKLHARLLGNPWTGNVRALLAEIERLYLSASDTVLADPELEASPTSTRSGGVRRVASDASWIEGPNGKRETIVGRRVLRSVLLALIDAHVEGGRLLAPRDIAQIAWPGERMLPRAATNRVYVAVTTLRKLGFGSSIENTAEGYRLTPGAVEVIPV